MALNSKLNTKTAIISYAAICLQQLKRFRIHCHYTVLSLKYDIICRCYFPRYERAYIYIRFVDGALFIKFMDFL